MRLARASAIVAGMLDTSRTQPPPVAVAVGEAEEQAEEQAEDQAMVGAVATTLADLFTIRLLLWRLSVPRLFGERQQTPPACIGSI